jgi:hypothetical protein
MSDIQSMMPKSDIDLLDAIDRESGSPRGSVAVGAERKWNTLNGIYMERYQKEGAQEYIKQLKKEYHINED